MHELSIAQHLVEIATEAARDAGARRVTRVGIRVGELSCVHREALEFCFDIVTKGTLLEGAELTIEEIPVEVYCPSCDRVSRLESIQRFRCARCGQATADIRRGRELELDSLEVDGGEESVGVTPDSLDDRPVQLPAESS